MSARKRKFETAIQPKFEAILGAQTLITTPRMIDTTLIADILVLIKPRLNDPKRSAWQSLISDLHKLAALAESINQHRPRTSHDWLSVADTLDREGVNLWNTSSSIKGGADDTGCEVVAALRFAAFRLIEAGLEPKPSFESWSFSSFAVFVRFTDTSPLEALIHVLQLASKAGASLSETSRHDLAAAVLTSAAKYEEQLRAADDPEKVHQQSKSQAIILYLSCRMEAAWKEGNDAVAEFMLQKITEDDLRLRSLRQPDVSVTQKIFIIVPCPNVRLQRESLACKLLEIGKAILRNVREAETGSDYQNALKWLQKAFSIAETSTEAADAGSQSLKRSILKSLARGYYLSASHDPDNLDRAEASLNELIRSVDMNIDPAAGEHQQFRWMRLAVLKKRNAAESELLDAFRSIIDHMHFHDSGVTDILQELKTLQTQHPLVVSVHQYALQKALDARDVSIPPGVDRLLLSLLFHCSKDADHSRAMRDIENSFTLAQSAELELPKVPTTACLTLLWQFGDRHYSAKRWAEAADWYMCGTQAIFVSMARSSHAKCFRKAALCHIQNKEFSRASAVLRRCSGNEAATHYVALLGAVQQGLEDEAIQAIQDMASAPDFDRKMLLLATQLANDSDMKALLLSVLETLLRTIQKQPGRVFHIEGLSLIRCIIRLVVKLMGEPAANSFVPALLGHFATGSPHSLGVSIFTLQSTLVASTMITDFQERKAIMVIAKDISWLWRTAYNCAVQGCTEWGDEEAVSHLFGVSRELLELYCTSVLTEADAELSVYLANASFAAVAGRVFSMRKRWETAAEPARENLVRSTSEHIELSLRRMRKMLDDKVLSGEARERVISFLHTVRIFHAEVSCHLKDWKQTLRVIENAVHCDTTGTDTLEAIADILWVEKDCPVQVLLSALEAVLHSTLERASLSVEKFSRWLRAICTILLSRNTQDDRTRAIGYVEQAITVLDEHPNDQQDEETIYPEDERQWLLGTTYNTGVECFHASLTGEAKRWFEAATVICRFTSDGKARAAKVGPQYTP
ncbi:hypothetical protein BC835DRAFT_1413864 [Cytidiella melzeri]|nr:hypothetical protein BC835DRAFT_1413864 [Cytidiella melzeri]